MSVADTVMDACVDLLDKIMLDFHNEDEIESVLYDTDIVELVALHLKIYEKSCYLKKDAYKLDNIDWIERSIEYIKKYHKEHYE